MQSVRQRTHHWYVPDSAIGKEFPGRVQVVTASFAPRILKRSLNIIGRLTLVFVVLVGVLKASLVEAFFVPSSSMVPTLRVNDYILVPKFLYGLRLPLIDDVLVGWSKPERGDVIVFSQKRTPQGAESDREALVKRVIGIEGDVVEIVGTQVYLNGNPLDEPYATWDGGGQLHPAPYHFGPYKVPRDRVFVLGDNRDRSEDSRSWREPFVPLSRVLGRAVMVYWSGDSRGRTGLFL